MERMTQVLQNTLPAMLESLLENRKKEKARLEEEKKEEEEGEEVRKKEEEEVVIPPPKEKGCSYKTFSSTRPKEFKGIEGPVALMNWITKMQNCSNICKFTEDQKVIYAATTFVDSELH